MVVRENPGSMRGPSGGCGFLHKRVQRIAGAAVEKIAPSDPSVSVAALGVIANMNMFAV